MKNLDEKLDAIKRAAKSSDVRCLVENNTDIFDGHLDFEALWANHEFAKAIFGSTYISELIDLVQMPTVKQRINYYYDRLTPKDGK